MNAKKLTALALTLLLTVGLLPISAAALQFTDITDAQTAENVEVLQMMDIINGVSYYSFQPEGSLTRAQFTKMAVMALGLSEQVEGYRNYTIFPDVKSTHWAVGYINLAVRGEQKFIAGFASGTFAPDEVITFGQAVTILMRLLGYTDTDVGLVWPTGYLNAATTAGLTDGVSVDGQSAITRAQAAQLFVNLLNCNTKDGSGTFAQSIAAGTEANAILLDANTTSDDGSPAIETTGGVYPLSGKTAPSLLQGRRGTVLLNSKGEAWGFLPETNGSVKTITVSAAKAGAITDLEGKEYTLTAKTEAIYRGETTTYGEIYVNLRSGTQVSLHLGITGKVERVFVAETSGERTMVIRQTASSSMLSSLAGGRTDYTIYRNGEQVTPAALKPYDVASYLPTENMIYVSTMRLTGSYEHAYPTASAPTSVTIMGREFEVMEAATATFAGYKVGEQITLLLTQDYQVAGVEKATTLRATAMGIATAAEGQATVEMLDGLTLQGKVSDSLDYEGELVSVSSGQAGRLTLARVKESSAGGSLSVADKTVGTTALAPNVRILERVRNSPTAEIALDEIRMDTVPADQIKYLRRNDQGKIDLILLDNVTGDRFLYGVVETEKVIVDYEQKLDEDGELVDNFNKPIYDKRMKINHGGETSEPFDPVELNGGSWGGVVMGTIPGKAAAFMTLTRIRDVTNEQWLDQDTVLIQQTPYSVSEQVVCYNRVTGKWVTLSEARTFGETMTLHVDSFCVVRGIEVG